MNKKDILDSKIKMLKNFLSPSNDDDEIKKGDIITFTINNETITHRVVDVQRDKDGYYYITKGESNNTNDSQKVMYKNVEGKYIYKIPKIGRIAVMLQSKFTLFAVIGVIILLYILDKKITEKRDSNIKQKGINKRMRIYSHSFFLFFDEDFLDGGTLYTMLKQLNLSNSLSSKQSK